MSGPTLMHRWCMRGLDDNVVYGPLCGADGETTRDDRDVTCPACRKIIAILETSKRRKR